MVKKSRWKSSASYRKYQRNYHKIYRVKKRKYLLKYYREWKVNNNHKTLQYHYGKSPNLTAEQYSKLIEKCAICGFKEIVNCHHIVPRCLGGNNHLSNLIGLCPNHHLMIHFKKYKLINKNGKFKLTFSPLRRESLISLNNNRGD